MCQICIKTWSGKCWKTSEVISGVQGEARYGLVLSLGIAQGWYQRWCGSGYACGYPGRANPELSHCPSLGVPGGQDRSSIGQVAQSGSQWELITLRHVWEGGRDTLCVLINFMHLPIQGFAKLEFIKPPPAPSLKATPTFFSWMTHC